MHNHKELTKTVDEKETTHITFSSNNKNKDENKDENKNKSENKKEDKKEKENDNGKKKRKRSKKKQWTEGKANTWIYVEGLPLTLTEDDIMEYFSKFGIINLEADKTPKIKLYYDENNKFKGSASICYLREASVELCIQLCDKMPYDYEHKDNILSISQAVFQMKNDKEYVPKQKTQYRKQAKVTRMELEQALSWNEEGLEDKGLKIVVLYNVFKPEDFKSIFIILLIIDKNFSNKLEKWVNDECGKFGHIDKITVFEKNVDGVIIVKFASSVSAEKCITFMKGKKFNGNIIISEFWDGVTNFQVKDDSEEEERLNKFGDKIEDDSTNSEWSNSDTD